MDVPFTLPGNLPIYNTSLFYAAGLALGLAVLAWQAPATELRRQLDTAIGVSFGSLLGARVGYVIFNWAYFESHPLLILNLSTGGLSWVGALCGALLALASLAYLREQPMAAQVDPLLPVAGGVSAAAWLACWRAGCAYGPTLDSWWALPAPDLWGQSALRLPTQLVGAVLAVVWFAGLIYFKTRFPIPGLAAAVGLLGLSIQLFLLTYLRADPMPIWQGLRWDAWSALFFCALSISYIYLLNKNNPAHAPAKLE
ncbi:MAG: prolipoprotein diacylglyceryl transferase [Anaerolineae bacterium]|nr:prolipoprotein diacylglyceryl transferase [Anaerolineae bacterium]